LAKEENPLLSMTKGEPNYPDLLEKEEGEAEDWGEKSSQAQCMRNY
jgi:hypothetical protein